MTIKDLVKKACKLIGENGLSQKIDELEPQFTEREDEIKSTLVDCFNFVQSELAENYIPFLCTENFVDKKVVNFDELTKRIVSVLEVKDKFKRNIEYKIYPTYLKADRDIKYFTYSYLPQNKQLEDEVESLIIPENIYLYGMVSEYYLISSMSTESEIFEERYKEGILNFNKSKTSIKLPCRRWI